MIVPDSWLIVYLIEHTAIHASAVDAASSPLAEPNIK
jgi:hypothetical protein